MCNYSKLKEEASENFEGDLWYLLRDFDIISDIALKPYPLYDKIVLYKIDGLQNNEI